jgi:cardiolipin synthase
MRRALPNLISTARLALVPPLAWMLWASRHSDRWRYGVIGLFFLIALTDWLDGYLARRWSAQSTLGKLLDPAADKMLALVSFVILIVAGRTGGQLFALPIWFVVVVVAKDAWTVLGYAVIRMMGIELVIRPSQWGKASTFFQLLLVGAILVEPELEKLHLAFALPVLLWLAAAATIAAGIDYSRVAINRLTTVQLALPPENRNNADH